MAAAVKICKPGNAIVAAQSNVAISNLEDIASYNWLDKTTPTILVPGIPPVWHVPGITPQLKPDTGTCYVEQNIDRNPWSPLEPMIRSVVVMRPDFDLKNLDIVTDRRPLRHLLDFVSGTAEDFEFGVEILGRTAVFTRMERRTRELIPAGKFQGYRRAFEEAYTKLRRSAEGSTSHHRIIGYRLGGLKLLVRSAVDAYLQDEVAGEEKSATKDHCGQDDLVNFMKAASLDTDAPSVKATPDAPGVTVVHGGENIAHSSVLEFTTRSKYAKRPFDYQAKYPDLWLSQTPHYVVAFHQHVGTQCSRQPNGQPRLAEFRNIQMNRMTENKLRSWEEDNQTHIRKLVVVLEEIIKESGAMDSPCIVRFSEARESLTISKIDPETFAGVPKDLRDKFSGGA